MVPLNTSKCVVCEASIPDQNKAQMTLKLSESKICKYCGTGWYIEPPSKRHEAVIILIFVTRP